MNNVHDTFQRIFATNPAVPQPSRQSINDSDIYVVDLTTRQVVKEYGSASATASDARIYGVAVKQGQTWYTGLELKGSGLVDLEAV